ncbi:hypothetical protein LSO9J_120035 [Candidatus Liberibacter solanacearum]
MAIRKELVLIIILGIILTSYIMFFMYIVQSREENNIFEYCPSMEI